MWLDCSPVLCVLSLRFLQILALPAWVGVFFLPSVIPTFFPFFRYNQGHGREGVGVAVVG